MTQESPGAKAIPRLAINSLAARRAKMMEVVPPLSLVSLSKTEPMAPWTPSPLSNRRTDVQPLSLCSRRGSEQLQIHAPPRADPAVCDDSGNRLDLASPSACCSTSPTQSCETWASMSMKSDESYSPSPGDFTMDAWGFETCTLLGVGSMASVYKVTRRSDRKDFAAKCVLAAEAEQVRELRREYTILKTLHHQSVVSVTEMYARQTDAWLCMELCRGGSIEDRIMQEGAFSEAVAVRLTRQLLEGISYLAERRVVHRDIKPMNLLLLQREAKQLKIADFNTAKQLGHRTGISAVMLSERGTQLYAAPELRFGLQWNERVDVWASGLCIFVMLQARHPFPSAKHRHLRALQQGHLPSLNWGTISKPMRNLVTQCLTVDMRDRPVPMELLEHCAFSASSCATLGPKVAKRSCECTVPISLSSCGLLTPSTNAVAAPKSLQRSLTPLRHAIWSLSQRRYQRLEGEVSQSLPPWTSPI